MNYITYTNIGNREKNEDAYAVSRYEDSVCFIVADGLGGHGFGEIASQIAVQAVAELFSQCGYSPKFFEIAFQRAQTAVLKEQEKMHARSEMKTTMIILVVDTTMTYWAHVGDSRLYFFKNRKYKFRTLDHSVPQMLAESGQIKEKDIRKHPDRSRLMRVIGINGEKVRFDAGEQKRRGKQTFLLCTDGFWEELEEKDMEVHLKNSSCVEDWINGLAELIQKKDVDLDNNTAIAVFIEDRGLFL